MIAAGLECSSCVLMLVLIVMWLMIVACGGYRCGCQDLTMGASGEEYVRTDDRGAVAQSHVHGLIVRVDIVLVVHVHVDAHFLVQPGNSKHLRTTSNGARENSSNL